MDQLRETINELKINNATTVQSINELTRSVGKLTDSVERSMERANERIVANEIKTSILEKDAYTLGVKFREHEEAHRWWAGATIAIATVMMAVVEFLMNLFRDKTHG